MHSTPVTVSQPMHCYGREACPDTRRGFFENPAAALCTAVGATIPFWRNFSGLIPAALANTDDEFCEASGLVVLNDRPINETGSLDRVKHE